MQLYPLKFTPIHKEMVWGGRNLETVLKKKLPNNKNIGEIWELSGVQGNISKIANGKLKGSTIQEATEIFMGELVGETLYEKFGVEFPLLIKFIDSSDNLSIQVHPDDEVASKRHHAYGKTEMWYIIDAAPEAELIVGFNQQIDKNQYSQLLENKALPSVLNRVPVKKGDLFFIPAGRIHAIGKGIVLAEIQQTSDITYRIYDWERNLPNRPLHTELALDVIDFQCYESYKTDYPQTPEQVHKVIECPYFTTSFLTFSQPVERNFSAIDSFVIYICTEGECKIICENGTTETISTGETILIPSAIKDSIQLTPSVKTTVLEVFIQ